MQLPFYQVDAFAEKTFSGNPAGVVPLSSWIEDELMQKIAAENNIAETAFFVPAEKTTDYDFSIRWFTPEVEIDLCGHATLGSAYVLFDYLQFVKPKIRFSSKSGILTVSRNADGFLYLDFPSWKPVSITMDTEKISQALGGVEIIGVYKNRDLVLELESEQAVISCNPDFSLLKKLGVMLMITAPGEDVDFVSRFFAPSAGIDEDPVTGSAHCQLIPFWAEKLGKNIMIAKQLSKRGGIVRCEQRGDRVSIGGNCSFYLKGEIFV